MNEDGACECLPNWGIGPSPGNILMCNHAIGMKIIQVNAFAFKKGYHISE